MKCLEYHVVVILLEEIQIFDSLGYKLVHRVGVACSLVQFDIINSQIIYKNLNQNQLSCLDLLSFN